MNLTLLRYWMLPSVWKRASGVWRGWLLLGTGLLSLSLALVPRRFTLPNLFPLLPYPLWFLRVADPYYPLFCAILHVLAASLGATAIARERERRTWEPLLLTHIGVGRLLTTKWVALCLLGMGGVALLMPYWVARDYSPFGLLPIFWQQHVLADILWMLFLPLLLLRAATRAARRYNDRISRKVAQHSDGVGEVK